MKFTKTQFILLFISVAIAAVAGYYVFKPVPEKLPDFRSYTNAIITQDTVDWELKTPPADSVDVLSMTFLGVDIEGRDDFTIRFRFDTAPVVLESVIGSQLGRLVFQVPFQTFENPDEMTLEGIDLIGFNPDEPIELLFIYEHDSGYRARHDVVFELE